MMQNHIEISSTTKFWIRKMRNSTKSRKSDMSGPAKTCPGGQVLTANQRKYFIFSEITPFLFSRNFYYCLQNHTLLLTNLSVFVKSFVLVSKFIIFYEIIFLLSKFIIFYKVIGLIKQIYYFL